MTAAADSDEGSIRIESVRNPDGRSQCLITWDSLQFYASAEDVRVTAADLLACVAYAEMLMVVAGMGLPAEHVSKLGADALRSGGRKSLGTAATMRLWPAGNSRTKTPAVQMRRGTHEAVIPVADARQIALQFLETAEAAESDDLITEAMIGVGITSEQADRAFRYLRELRAVG